MTICCSPPVREKFQKKKYRTGIDYVFAIDTSTNDWLLSHDFDVEENELIVTREFVRKEERITSRFRLNGMTVNKDLITSLRPFLIGPIGMDL